MYMEDLSDPSKMAVIVMPKQNPATGWGMYSGDVTVPATIEHDLDTYEVVGLSSGCFMCPNLTGLDIKASLKTVANASIMGDNIKSLKLPDSIEDLPISSVNVPNVEELFLGKSLKTVSLSFSQLNKLNSLNIPSSIESIETSFYTCDKLQSLEVKGDNLSLIRGSFFGMPELESLVIGGNNLSIEGAFINIENLKQLDLSGVNKIIGSFGKINVDKLTIPEGVEEINASFLEFNGTELTLPNSLTKLEGYSFWSCKNLKTVRLGKGVCSIGNFTDTKDVEIYCPWDEVPEVPDFHSNSKVTFVVPVGMEAKYREAWGNKLEHTNAQISFKEQNF